MDCECHKIIDHLEKHIINLENDVHRLELELYDSETALEVASHMDEDISFLLKYVKHEVTCKVLIGQECSCGMEAAVRNLISS